MWKKTKNNLDGHFNPDSHLGQFEQTSFQAIRVFPPGFKVVRKLIFCFQVIHYDLDLFIFALWGHVSLSMPAVRHKGGRAAKGLGPAPTALLTHAGLVQSFTKPGPDIGPVLR